MSTTVQLDLLKGQEVADLLRVSRRHIYRLAERGEIPAIQIGTQWRFDRADIMAWIEAQRNKRG